MTTTQVLKIPNDMTLFGRGPLVSAHAVDTDITWERARQAAKCMIEVGLSSSNGQDNVLPCRWAQHLPLLSVTGQPGQAYTCDVDH